MLRARDATSQKVADGAVGKFGERSLGQIQLRAAAGLRSGMSGGPPVGGGNSPIVINIQGVPELKGPLVSRN